MNYGNIKNFDISNGEGIRVSLFVSGCRNNCKGCFNKEAQNFHYGKPYTKETEDYIIKLLSNEHIKGLSILGGEPLEPENQQDVLNLILRVREELPDKDIWLWSGFYLEELKRKDCRANTPIINKILDNINYIVEGRFIEELKDLNLKFKGSSNQNIIHLNN